VTEWWWLVFGAVVLLLLTLDLAVFHRHARHESTRRALLWSVIWIGLGLGFSLFVGQVRGHDAALAYLTAYLIEESLSVDNLFVFLALFTYFGVASEHQHRVLFWGIVGAIIFRGIFIFAGVALISRFHWVIYILGILLVATGAKLGLGEAEQVHPERNLIVRWASRVLPMQKSFHGERFTVRSKTGLRFTPLFLVLLAIESTDVMFAVDSVPAVLAVSRDAFVVYTSNIFAVLGLRALYFVLAGALRSLRLLRPALAIILVLVGVKMLLADVVEIPTEASLVVVGTILVAATAASLVLPALAKRSSRSGR
jgi:tellurite resistance protein TerC